MAPLQQRDDEAQFYLGKRSSRRKTIIILALLLMLLISLGSVLMAYKKTSEINLESAELVQKINSVFDQKLEAEALVFKQRFPRDHRYVSGSKMLSFQPKASAKLLLTDTDFAASKVQEIFESVDENLNGALDPWEMHDWMLFLQSHVQKHSLDQQWHDLSQAENDSLKWPDFVFKVNNAFFSRKYSLHPCAHRHKNALPSCLFGSSMMELSGPLHY